MKKRGWIEEFSVDKDGFYGHLYRPEIDKFPTKAVLVIGGGGMPYSYTLDEAEAFVQMGITALSFGYFGVPGTPKTIVKVPIEYVQKATEKLHAMEIKTVIAAGISKGAELALVAGSLLPQINGVIAFAPSARVYMAVGDGISWLNASSWTFEGKELPYAYAHYSGWKALWNTICAGELTFRPAYEKANQAATEDSIIPVEKIQGPVLVAGAVHDSLWPSALSCQQIAKRLEANNFAYPYKQLVYEYASHILLPFDNSYGIFFHTNRKYPQQCKDTVHQLYDEVLAWLKLC